MSHSASVQATHLAIQAIEDGVVHLVGGRYRAVLEVGAVNFGLQGEGEQEATIAGFAAFLNSLTFPLQILVRVLPLDIEAYLRDLEGRLLRLPEQLVPLAHDHLMYLRRLARSRALLQRRFYVIVPADGDAAPRAGFSWLFRRKTLGPTVDVACKQLSFRCEEVRGELGRCGLTARRLASLDLAQLFYACWCPELVQVQRVRHDLADYAALVVQASRPKERRS